MIDKLKSFMIIIDTDRTNLKVVLDKTSDNERSNLEKIMQMRKGFYINFILEVIYLTGSLLFCST